MPGGLPELHVGVPPHLQPTIKEWLSSVLQHNGVNVVVISSVLQFPIRHVGRAPNIAEGDADTLIGFAFNAGDEKVLDLVDATLALVNENQTNWASLDFLLDIAGSAWMVRPDHKGLQERVPATTHEAVTSALTAADRAADQLSQAWAAAYGRTTDASDAWDHAIKAVEAVLNPLCIPNDQAPTLGKTIRHLRDAKAKWQLNVGGEDGVGPIDPLLAMLDVVWVNPDRHEGGGEHTRTPSLAEARAVVQLAVTIVQWGRTGVLSKL